MILFLGLKLCGVFVQTEETLKVGDELTLLQDNVIAYTGFGCFMFGRRVRLCKVLPQARMLPDDVLVPAFSVKFLPPSEVVSRNGIDYG